ncbi:ankyrin repeat domain-containing protein [Spirosoma panaciterrae]|uniref:ankyrin repeat domain-containing protein n=1 Tax=Spirosoma panaciterrae TaxID=496058 RepID=UPI000369CC77|nr:ankyrin repeat domain-containing protein [Spirosoma panaciterrae]
MRSVVEPTEVRQAVKPTETKPTARLKYVTGINWIGIGMLALFVMGSLLFPTKGGDAAGRGIGEAFEWLTRIGLIGLLILNLIPYAWAKYLAFTLIMLPPAFLLLNQVGSDLKDIVKAITYSQSDYDGSRYFAEPKLKKLLAAIFDQNVDKVESLLEDPIPEINNLDTHGEQTVLDYLATNFSPYTRDWGKTRQIMELLLAAGATINSTTPARISTHAASLWNATPEMLKFFLDHGADPNAIGSNGVSILYEAIRSGGDDSIDKVRLLLDRGADCRQVGTYDQNTKAYTPLLFASAFGCWDTCLLLIQRGSDVHYTSPDGTNIQTYIDFFEDHYKGADDLRPVEFDQVKAVLTKMNRTNRYLGNTR